MRKKKQRKKRNFEIYVTGCKRVDISIVWREKAHLHVVNVGTVNVKVGNF